MSLAVRREARWKPYPSYRPSGVDWLGDVPQHWEVKRLRFLIGKAMNGIWGEEPDDAHDIACVRVADFDRTTFRVRTRDLTLRSISKDERQGRLLAENDLLIEKSGGGENQLVGAVVLWDRKEEAVCSNFIARAQVERGVIPSFACYLFATLYSGKLNFPAIKQTTGIQNLDLPAYLNLRVAVPSPEEQHCVASFLDRETAKIDALVEKKRRLIELLKEKRAALITHAVTKGLDPSAPMKDSGIPWLGLVPTDWANLRCKHVFIERDERVGTEDIPLLALTRDGLIPRAEMTQKAAEADSYLDYKRCLPNDLVMNKMQAWNGAFAVAREAGMVSPDYTVFSPIRPNASEWCRELFRTSSYRCEFLGRCRGMGTGFLRLNSGDFFCAPLFLPAKSEMESTLAYIRRRTTSLDSLLHAIERHLDLLGEYRSALISAAVTGKIDVREVM